MAEKVATPYEQWIQGEGIPTVRGYAVEDMYQVPLKPWDRKGGLGAFIVLEGSEGWNSAYLCEIPRGVTLKPQRHIFEEMIYILQGQGETTVWNEDGPKQTFAWQEYSLFAVPLNAWHQHRNTGNEPAKYVAITDAPLLFNLFRDADFIFNSKFAFKNRYRGEKDYFGAGEMAGEKLWKGAFIRDVRQPEGKTQFGGPGFRSLTLSLSGNSWGAHLGQVEVGAYKKAHRHNGGAHIIVAQGVGYAYMWKDGGKRIRADYKKGSLYSPPEGWWHMHFNTGSDVVRHIAFRGLPGVDKRYFLGIPLRQGGDVLEFEDEDPEIRRIFEEELRKKGLKCNLPPVH